MEDTTYQRLAEVRYLTRELFEELDSVWYVDSDGIDGHVDIRQHTREQARTALGGSNRAVHDYVKSWLQAYRKEAADE